MSALKIVVSGAAGQIAYSLLPLSTYCFLLLLQMQGFLIEETFFLLAVCTGQVFGADQRVQLRLLDIPVAQDALEGVKMELQDCAYNLVDGEF